MSLVTLANVKTRLGISGTTEDAALTLWLRDAIAVIRDDIGRYVGGMISAVSAANPAVVTAIGHQLQDGDTIVIGGSNCSPTIDGERVVTYLTDDTFSVPVAVTTAGTAGYYSPKITEYYAGNGTPQIALNERPVQSISSVYEDSAAYYGEASGAFASATLLTAGSDYCLLRDNGSAAEQSLSGILLRVGGRWPAANEQLRGLLASGVSQGVGNIKVTYIAGWLRVPSDLQAAVSQLVGEFRLNAAKGGPLQQESLDYYSYTRMSGSELAGMMTSVERTLRRYRKAVI